LQREIAAAKAADDDPAAWTGEVLQLSEAAARDFVEEAAEWSVCESTVSRSINQLSDPRVGESGASLPNSFGKKCSGCMPNGFPTTRNRVGVVCPGAAVDSSKGSVSAPPRPWMNLLRLVFMMDDGG
jgi:hypothetical protein